MSRAGAGAAALLAVTLLVGGCSRDSSTPGGASAPAVPAPSAPAVGAAAARAVAAAPAREPLVGGPYPALLVAQAQFNETVASDGTKKPVPGYAKLLIVRKTDGGWQTVTLEDPDSNAFHKALAYDGGILTIGATQAMLKLWHFANGAWTQETHWNPKFGGKFDRLRDIEQGDVDGDRKDDLVIATHDQGVIAVVHPDQNWKVDEIDHQADTFVHEIELGDVDGDGTLEIFATPSKPNKLDQEQPGEVRMYRYGRTGWKKSVVDAPGDTHAKEILTADVDGNHVAELFVVWEGAVGAGGALVRPVTIKEYKLLGSGTFVGTEVASVPDRQMRAIAAGDVNGDGKIDLVAGALSSGLWLFEQDGAGWKKTLIDANSSGFEHPVCLADLDGDGALEIYVAAEDQHELRQYRWQNGAFQKSVVAQLHPGDITWNITAGKF
ncbi:MAG: VCBS repeat-containing protein [Deltaproteobacteria bacterium]|nr:VCBS repeat-containing protein [Deltaproteobacteria bacterium]